MTREALLTLQDVRLYAALARCRAASGAELAEQLGLRVESTVSSLKRLAGAGFITSLGERRWTTLLIRKTAARDSASSSLRRCTSLSLDKLNNTKNIKKNRARGVAAPSTKPAKPYRNPASYPTSNRPMQKEVKAAKPQERVTRRELFTAHKAATDGGEWSTHALAGLYLQCYVEKFSLKYGGPLGELVAEIQLLHSAQEELAYWCVQAIWSETMNWVKQNRLGFLSNAGNCQKWIVPIALEQRKTAGGEITQSVSVDDAVGGVVHDPLNRR